MRKLKWIRDLAKETEADAVLDGEDFFDVVTIQNSLCQRHLTPIATILALSMAWWVITTLSMVSTSICQSNRSLLFSSGVFREFGDDKDVVFEKDGGKG